MRRGSSLVSSLVAARRCGSRGIHFSASSVKSIMAAMEILVIWIVVAVVAAIVASNRGRSGAGWFFLCLLATPLAILVLLALPTLKPPEPQFEPTAVLKGFPYRLRGDGTVDAMMTGGLVHFHNMDLFHAAAEGRDADSVGAEFPDELHGYSYRVEKDGSVSAVDRRGPALNSAIGEVFGRLRRGQISGWRRLRRAQSCSIKAFLNPPLHYGLMFRLVAINCVKTGERLVLSFVPTALYSGQTPRKRKGVKEMSKDFVYGALTLLLAVGVVIALVFFQGKFSV
jgi:hypothetical protein